MQDTTVLMSSPEYFKVEYSINPWMVEGVNVDLEDKVLYQELQVLQVLQVH